MCTCVLLLALLVAGMAPAWAQPTWTFHVRDRQDPSSAAGRFLDVISLTNGDQVLAIGRLLSWRLPADQTQAPVALTCPDGTDGFTRTTTDVRQGFLAEGWNEATDTVGNDAGRLADGVLRLVGVSRLADGTCHIYRYPGAVNTLLTSINTAGDTVGWYQMPLPANLRSRNGFVRKADGTLLAFNGLGADAAIFPEHVTDDGRVGGYAFTQINAATNAYVYTAFLCEQFVQCLPVKAPNGQNLWITGMDGAYATALTASGQRQTGGQPWLIHVPSKTFWAIQGPTIPGYTIPALSVRGLNALGWLVGRYTQREDGCVITTASQCDTSHTFVAIPDGPLPLPAGIRKTKWRALLEWWASKHERVHDWREAHRDEDDTRWLPAWKEGKLVLMRGQEVIGE